jgi:predicted Zn finger-like uncharacterized protein
VKIYTQCSHCESVFAVTETQMAHKSGWVRCGHCKEPFNAYARRLSDPIEADSFIDPGAEFATNVVEVSPDPDAETQNEVEKSVVSERPKEWRSFELVLDSDEDEAWEESDESGDGDEDEGEGEGEDSPDPDPAKSLDLDFSGFETDEIPAETLDTSAEPDESGEEPDGDVDLSPAEAGADDGKAAVIEPAEPEFGDVPDRPVSSTVAQEEKSDPVDGNATAESDEEREMAASQPQEREEPSVEKVVEPYPGSASRPRVPLDTGLSEEQEVTIDPVFTIEENYYDFTRQAKRAKNSWKKIILYVIGLLVLAGLLVWQIAERYHEVWIQNNALRPAIVQWCSVLHCEVAPLRDIRRVELVGTSISTHDEVAGALQVTIQLINRAEFEQAYPALEVSLTDRAGTVVGRRTLIPYEFLGLDSGDGNLPSRQLISIVLDLASPPATAVGYEVRIIDI